MQTVVQPFTPEEQAAWDSSSDAVYRLRRGDVFDVLFKYYPDMDQRSVRVLPDGRVSLPHIATAKAVDLSIAEFDSLVTSMYAEDYMNPDLSIVIREFGSLQVYVFGEVNRPGAVVMPYEDGNVLQAIAAAGGFNDNASTSEVLHVRVTEEGYRYTKLDLSHLEKRMFMTSEVGDLRLYDMIYVPQSALGDLHYFQRSVLASAMSVTDIFWDVYAMMNLDKINQMVR